DACPVGIAHAVNRFDLRDAALPVPAAGWKPCRVSAQIADRRVFGLIEGIDHLRRRLAGLHDVDAFHGLRRSDREAVFRERLRAGLGRRLARSVVGTPADLAATMPRDPTR